MSQGCSRFCLIGLHGKEMDYLELFYLKVFHGKQTLGVEVGFDFLVTLKMRKLG